MHLLHRIASTIYVLLLGFGLISVAGIESSLASEPEAKPKVFLLDFKNGKFQKLIIQTSSDPLIESAFDLIDGKYQLSGFNSLPKAKETKAASSEQITELICSHAELKSASTSVHDARDIEFLLLKSRIRDTWLQKSCGHQSDRLADAIARALTRDRAQQPKNLYCFLNYHSGIKAFSKLSSLLSDKPKIECSELGSAPSIVTSLEDDLDALETAHSSKAKSTETESKPSGSEILLSGIDPSSSDNDLIDQVMRQLLQVAQNDPLSTQQISDCCGLKPKKSCELVPITIGPFNSMSSLSAVDEVFLAHPEIREELISSFSSRIQAAGCSNKTKSNQCTEAKMRSGVETFVKSDFLNLCLRVASRTYCEAHMDSTSKKFGSAKGREDIHACVSINLGKEKAKASSSVCSVEGDFLKSTLPIQTEKPKNGQSNVTVQNTSSEIQYQPLRVENTQDARIAAREYAAPARILAGQWSGVLGDTAHASTSSSRSSSSDSRLRSSAPKTKSKPTKSSSRAVTLEADDAGRCVWLPNGKCVTATIDSNLTNLQINVDQETTVNVPKLGTIKGRARSNFVSPTENRYQDSGGSSETPDESSKTQARRASASKAAEADVDSSPRPSAGGAVAAASSGSGGGAQARVSGSSSSGRSPAHVELPPRDVGSVSALRKTLAEFDGDPVVILSQKWMRSGLESLSLRIKYNGVDDDGAPRVYFFGPSKAKTTRSYEHLVRGHQ